MHVEDCLSSQETYALYKPVCKRFPRNPYTITNIGDSWEMDLADERYLSKYNDKYKYLLDVIDLYSLFPRSVPLKDKSATSIILKLFI
jgi:hypothetical protein